MLSEPACFLLLLIMLKRNWVIEITKESCINLWCGNWTFIQTNYFSHIYKMLNKTMKIIQIRSLFCGWWAHSTIFVQRHIKIIHIARKLKLKLATWKVWKIGKTTLLFMLILIIFYHGKLQVGPCSIHFNLVLRADSSFIIKSWLYWQSLLALMINCVFFYLHE